ncbi:MAG TPA: hypothetical protein VIM53_04300 [Candidatus Saccharimonadales bacterium]
MSIEAPDLATVSEVSTAQVDAIHTEADQAVQAAAAREAALRQLMPLDYDDAVANGIVDAYYFDPATGQDGLIHMLAGNSKTNRNGVIINGGFHHGPSGELAWPHVMDGKGAPIPSTRTTYEHRRRSFEPYDADVVIGGILKTVQRVNPSTGRRDSQPVTVQSSMFPKEYDSFMVAKGVAEAARSRNKANDVVSPDLSYGREVVETLGKMRLVDGSRRMEVKLILDRRSGKILTAYPLINTSPYFKKGEAENRVFTEAGYRKKS